MADPLDPAANIYEGTWTDWSRGKVWGLTWTLCPTQAIILTNALAVFVTISGIRLWAIVRFTIYHFSTTTEPNMTPHLRDRQVILRNAGSDLATAWLMLRLACSSRRQSTGKKSWSSYGIGVFAMIYTVLFWIAGVFSNKAISASSADGTSLVLTRSKHCGIWNQTYLEIVNNPSFDTEYSLDLFVERKAQIEHDTQLGLEYAQACYLSQSALKYMSSTCNTMKRPALNWTMRSDSCPFAPRLCSKNSPVVVLDTGEINSHTDLGINANPKDRLTYQRLTTCAALDNSDYIEGWNGTISDSIDPEPETAYAYYGPSLYKNTNWTYAYSNFASFYNPFTTEVTLPYQLEPQLAYAPANPQYSVSDFDPIADIAQDEADVVLLFLSYMGSYTGAVEDPWFSANREQTFPGSPQFLQSRFFRDTAISTIGCTVKHQFCTHNTTCTGFGGFDQVQNNAIFSASLTPHQNATFNRILEAVTYSELKFVVENSQRTITPLLASNKTMSGRSGAVVSSGLPKDQWITEVNFMHSVTMAQLQRSIVRWATGQIAAEQQYLLPPTEDQDKWFCRNMIIPSIVYQSFSLVAIILIVVFGTLVISISLTIEDIASLVRKTLNQSPPPRSWDHFDMLSNRTPMRSRFPSAAGLRPRLSNRRPNDEGLELERIPPTPNIHRISSPTLPPEDRAISIIDFHTNFSRPRGRLPPEPPPRPARDSGIAISLNDLDLEPPQTSTRTMERHDWRRAPLRIIPPALLAQRPAQEQTHGHAINLGSWV